MVWKIFFTHPGFPGGGGELSMLEFSVAGIPLCKNLHTGLDFWHDLKNDQISKYSSNESVPRRIASKKFTRGSFQQG